MNSSRAMTVIRLAVLAWFPWCLTSAQTTNRIALKAGIARVPKFSPTIIRAARDTSAREAMVEVKPPMNLDRYRVVEQDGHAVRLATNLLTARSDRFRAPLRPGSTLLFMEKNPPAVRPAERAKTRSLFSTFLIRRRASPPSAPVQTDSGTLTVLADMPIPWVAASNAYVNELSVMLVSDNEASNSLLPMTVAFQGTHVTRIEPRQVSLRQAGPEGSKEVWVVCERYRPDVAITAYYQNTNTTCALTLQHLSLWDMSQMILSAPMLFAALAGGLIGGLLRLFKGANWKPGRVGRYLAEGAVVGIVSVAMLLSGLLHTQIAGLTASPQMVLAFSLAAAAGSVGSHFLDRAVDRLRGRQAAAPVAR